MKFKPLKVFLLLVFLSVLISFVINPKAPANQYYVGVAPPLVIAHQGGDGIITDRPDLTMQILGK